MLRKRLLGLGREDQDQREAKAEISLAPEVLEPAMMPAGVGAFVVWLLALRRGPQPWLEDVGIGKGMGLGPRPLYNPLRGSCRAFTSGGF